MRMKPEMRKRMILNAGVSLASNIGLSAVTYENLAEACPIKTSPATVRKYFTTLPELWLSLANGGSAGLKTEAKALGLNV